MLGFMARGRGGVGVSLVTYSLVGSIEPTRLLFNRIRLDSLVQLLCFNQALARGAWVQAST